jgi:uncharacterized membrane protein YphA (DoxX/SURF4 family)
MTAKKRFDRAQPWITLAMRLGAAAVFIIAGAQKVLDLPASVRATRAYAILPEALVPLAGNALPFVEILIGFFLLFGLLARWAALAYLLLLAAFVVGTIWVWVKGIQIECGCFGGGGYVEKASYGGHVRDQLLFIAMGAWVAVFPSSPFSLDRWLKAAG